jgi:hypothetical protein
MLKRNQEALLDESGGIPINTHSLNRKRNAVNLSDEQLQQQQKKKKRNSLKIPEPLSGGKKGSLLKKLFEKEILTEENLILQAIRFICKSNFFDKEIAKKENQSVSMSNNKQSQGSDDNASDYDEDEGSDDQGVGEESEEVGEQVISIKKNEIGATNVQKGIQSLLDIYASSENENDSVRGEEGDVASVNSDEDQSLQEENKTPVDNDEDKNGNAVEQEESTEPTVNAVNQS